MPVPSNWCEQLREFVGEWEAVTGSLAAGKDLSDRPFDKLVLTEQAASWQDCLAWLNEFRGSWGFRGQRESSWTLDTSLDRAVKVAYSRENSSGCYHLDREAEERELLLRFQQQAHHHFRDLPSIDDFGTWLAIMQHYGVPTRLLDWTKSPYVALYFAAADEPHEVCSAVWAVDLQWLQNRGGELLSSEALPLAMNNVQGRAEQLNCLLRDTEKQVIIHIDPLSTSERMIAQQGLLLCKLFNKATFSQILMGMMIHPEVPSQPVLRKLTVEKHLRIEILKRLREMNIHGASLFPGTDRFGKSLTLDLEIKVMSAQVAA